MPSRSPKITTAKSTSDQRKVSATCYDCGEQHLKNTRSSARKVTKLQVSLPTRRMAVRRYSQVTSTTHDTNRHLNVQPPPQRIIVKGTVRGRIVPPAIVSSLQHQRQQGKQCQENNSSLQLQRGSTLLRQHPQQVLSAPGRPTVVSSSNAPHIAPIRRPVCKSPLGNPMSKKIPPAIAVKRIAIPSPKINAQSNVSDATSISRN
uniref:Uncharacterized protein n=1 Tax=Oryza rufipogon TaxID=4529 RepID=A0A0E0P5P4_ORYRU